VAVFTLAGVLAVAGCDRFRGGSTAAESPDALPGMSAIAAVPLGDVIGGQMAPGTPIGNPYHGKAEAVAQGRELFVRMNCAGCHGYEAKGGMGPNLRDGYWRYGGAPVQVFKSIYEGRPQGMPAWNPALPPDEIWKLVAYVQSLGGTYPEGGVAASAQGDKTTTQYASQVGRVLPAGAGQPKPPKPGGQGAPAQPRPDTP
jgi:cytochrome c oxidase cbb3-type subunit 3